MCCTSIAQIPAILGYRENRLVKISPVIVIVLAKKSALSPKTGFLSSPTRPLVAKIRNARYVGFERTRSALKFQAAARRQRKERRVGFFHFHFSNRNI